MEQGRETEVGAGKNDPSRYSCGMSIYPSIFMEERKWCRVFGVGDGEPSESFPVLFEWLRRVQLDAGLPVEVKTNIHFGSGMHGLFQHDWFAGPYLEQAALLDFPYVPTAHIPFSEKYLPHHEGFVPMLVEQLEQGERLGYRCVVIHAPRDPRDTTEQYIDELTGRTVREAIRRSKITLAVENTQDQGKFFRSLGNLVQFRERLGERLSDLGDGDLMQYFQFCFDTGHYLLYQQRDGEGEGDWEDWGEKFICHTAIFHVQANDGTSDQHLLPYTACDLPASKSPVDRARFLKNSDQILEWLHWSDGHWAIPERHLVLEVEPWFTRDEVVHFWKVWGEGLGLVT
ncbi:MAG: TIM barrel protein [Promethearchaeota archaeon]